MVGPTVFQNGGTHNFAQVDLLFRALCAHNNNPMLIFDDADTQAKIIKRWHQAYAVKLHQEQQQVANELSKIIVSINSKDIVDLCAAAHELIITLGQIVNCNTNYDLLQNHGTRAIQLINRSLIHQISEYTKKLSCTAEDLKPDLLTSLQSSIMEFTLNIKQLILGCLISCYKKILVFCEKHNLQTRKVNGKIQLLRYQCGEFEILKEDHLQNIIDQVRAFQQHKQSEGNQEFNTDLALLYEEVMSRIKNYKVEFAGKQTQFKVNLPTHVNTLAKITNLPRLIMSLTLLKSNIIACSTRDKLTQAEYLSLHHALFKIFDTYFHNPLCLLRILFKPIQVLSEQLPRFLGYESTPGTLITTVYQKILLTVSEQTKQSLEEIHLILVKYFQDARTPLSYEISAVLRSKELHNTLTPFVEACDIICEEFINPLDAQRVIAIK